MSCSASAFDRTLSCTEIATGGVAVAAAAAAAVAALLLQDAESPPAAPNRKVGKRRMKDEGRVAIIQPIIHTVN